MFVYKNVRCKKFELHFNILNIELLWKEPVMNEENIVLSKLDLGIGYLHPLYSIFVSTKESDQNSMRWIKSFEFQINEKQSYLNRINQDGK